MVSVVLYDVVVPKNDLVCEYSLLVEYVVVVLPEFLVPKPPPVTDGSTLPKKLSHASP